MGQIPSGEKGSALHLVRAPGNPVALQLFVDQLVVHAEATEAAIEGQNRLLGVVAGEFGDRDTQTPEVEWRLRELERVL